MDELKDKVFLKTDYLSRYTTVPCYYNTVYEKEIMGIGTSLNTNYPYVLHKVTQEDTFDSLSLKYYNNPTYWWYIAEFNKILDPFIHIIEHYNTLKIPNISNVDFKGDR